MNPPPVAWSVCNTCKSLVADQSRRRVLHSEDPGNCSVSASSFVVSMSAFDDLYAKYAGVVFRYALKCVGRRDVAEDTTSEVFLMLHRHLARLDTDRLPGWLFTVAKNRSVDYWRRAQVEQRYAEMLPADEITWEPSLEFWLGEARGLKPIHRACLILRYVHGMDQPRSPVGSDFVRIRSRVTCVTR